MSHLATIELKIKDLGSLAKAASDLGMELVKDQAHFKYYGDWQGDCTHLLRVKDNKDPYEVGVQVQEDGTFQLIYDNFCGGRGLTEHTGGKMEKVVKGYGKHVAIKHARRQGFNVRESVDNKGQARLTCTRSR